MKSIPTARIILDTRRTKQNGLYPVKLRITFERKHRYYPTGKDISEVDFQSAFGAKPREKFKEIREYLFKVEKLAKDAIHKTMPFFSFEDFEANYYPPPPPKKADLKEAYSTVIESLKKEGRTGNAYSLKCSIDSLLRFSPSLNFGSITPDLLLSYERWMLAEGKSITTVGIYLRALRSILNEAIQKGLINSAAYPFGKKPLYRIPAGQNIKKALSRADLQKIFKYEPTTATEARARDFWIFSYLCNGINPKDIAELKYSNLDRATQKITFRRAKTKRTSRDSKPAEIYLQPMAVEILERYATKPEHPEAYIFPILTPGDDAKRQDDDISNFLKLINKPMARIAEKLGIDKPVTASAARHSFATMLKRSGAPTEFISESLSHQNLSTTENYLDSFEDTTKRKFGKALLDFTGED